MCAGYRGDRWVNRMAVGCHINDDNGRMSRGHKEDLANKNRANTRVGQLGREGFRDGAG